MSLPLSMVISNWSDTIVNDGVRPDEPILREWARRAMELEASTVYAGELEAAACDVRTWCSYGLHHSPSLDAALKRLCAALAKNPGLAGEPVTDATGGRDGAGGAGTRVKHDAGCASTTGARCDCTAFVEPECVHETNHQRQGADSPTSATIDPSADQDHAPARHNAQSTVGALQEATETPRVQSAPATNYIANAEVNPTRILFASGRTVELVDGRLEVGWAREEAASVFCHQSCTQDDESIALEIGRWVQAIEGPFGSAEYAIDYLRDGLVKASAWRAASSHQVGRDVPTTGLGRALAYEEMVKAFHAWLDSRPAGYNGDGVGNPGGRWFDAFTAGARWWHVAGKKS